MYLCVCVCTHLFSGVHLRLHAPRNISLSLSLSLSAQVWICAFMLCGALHGGITVGEVESEHSAELRSLIDELGAAGEKELGVTLAPGAYER